MQMKHIHPDEDLLERYSMGSANEAEVEFVEEHLLICELCRINLEKFEAERYLMRLAFVG